MRERGEEEGKGELAKVVEKKGNIVQGDEPQADGANMKHRAARIGVYSRLWPSAPLNKHTVVDQPAHTFTYANRHYSSTGISRHALHMVMAQQAMDRGCAKLPLGSCISAMQVTTAQAKAHR